MSKFGIEFRTFCTVTVTVLFFVPIGPTNASGAANNILRNLGPQAARIVVKAGNKPQAKEIAQRVVQTAGKAKNAETSGLVQKLAHPNVPNPAVSDVQALFTKYQKNALEALKFQWGMHKQYAQRMEAKMLFGLKEIPAHAGQLVHVPTKLAERGINQGALSYAMHYLGHKMNNQIWRLAKAMKRLPPRTAMVLSATFVFAEWAHTRDEWTQATAKPITGPDGIGFSIPSNWAEFKEGLANAALDILPDFAFAVPAALFVANPPAAIIWAGWLAVGEYFAKKAWSLVLRDVALETEHGKDFEKMLEDNHMAKEEEMVSVKQAVIDSQVDSNLYQYLFMNTIFLYTALANSIYAGFMGEMQKVEKGEIEKEEMTEFARNMMAKMKESKKEKTGGKTPKNRKSEGANSNPKTKWTEVFGTAPRGESKMKEDEIVQGIVEDKGHRQPNKWIENMMGMNKVLKADMPKEVRQSVEAMAQGISRHMVWAEPGEMRDIAKVLAETDGGAKDLNESFKTMANVIMVSSQSPEILEEMVEVKLGGKPMPICEDFMIEAYQNQEFGQSLYEESLGKKEKSAKICKMPKTKKSASLKRNESDPKINLMPLLEEEAVEELDRKFKDSIEDIIRINRIVRMWQNSNAPSPAGESADPHAPQCSAGKGSGTNKDMWQEAREMVKLAKAAEELNQAGKINRMRQGAFEITRTGNPHTEGKKTRKGMLIDQEMKKKEGGKTGIGGIL